MGSLLSSDSAALIGALAPSGSKLVIIASGGGAGAIAELAATPGASEILLEATVPYARAAVDELLGGSQESYCSSPTARRLAVAAWDRARLLAEASGTDPAQAAWQAVGVAVTAGLKTREPKRGDHRVIVAVHTSGATRLVEARLEKEARSRSEEEAFAAGLVLSELAAVSSAPGAAPEPSLRPGDRLHRDYYAPPESWRELFRGERQVVVAQAGADAGDDTIPTEGGLIFPGSYNPLHEGHLLMARIAEEIAERTVAYEISIRNVDKPTLDFIEMRDRAAQFADRPLWLTRAATFVEKLEIFPKSTFVLGADTYARLPDPRYYGGSAAAATRAVKTIAARARGLIVFGRAVDGVFHDAASIEVPKPLRDVTYFVSQREFRVDISSSDLRRRSQAGSDA